MLRSQKIVVVFPAYQAVIASAAALASERLRGGLIERSGT
mgnify:CR=1 FL=1